MNRYTVVATALFIVACLLLGVGVHEAEDKSLGITWLAEFLIILDLFGLYWQIPAFIDARKDWQVIQNFPEWGKRRVRYRYGTNIARLVVLPLALALAITVFVVKQQTVYQPDFPATFEGTITSLYIVVSEIVFVYFAYRDNRSRHTILENDPFKDVQHTAHNGGHRYVD